MTIVLPILYLNQVHRNHQKTMKTAFPNPHMTWSSQDFLKRILAPPVRPLLPILHSQTAASQPSTWNQFIASDLVHTIVNQTDLYAQRQIATELPKQGTKQPRSEQWRHVTITEIKKCHVLMIPVFTGILSQTQTG
jgi:hypothetical protein